MSARLTVTAVALATLGAIALAPLASPGVRELALPVLGVELLFAAAAWAAASRGRQPAAQRLGLGPGRTRPAGLALLVVGTLCLSHGLDRAMAAAGLRDSSALAEFDARVAGAGGPDLALLLICVALAPGFAEELLCRGLAQRGLAPKLGTPLAIAVGAALFGALHLEWVHGVFAAVLGLYLGAVAALTGSVRSAILCHATNNTLAVAFAAAAPGLATKAGATAAVAWGLCGAAAAVAAFWGAARLQQTPRPDDA